MSKYTGQSAQWDAQGLPINIEAALCDALQWLMHAQDMGCWQKTSNRQALAATINHSKRFVGNEQKITKKLWR